MALTLAEANRIVAGTIAKAEELNIKVNVAVCDAGGRLVAFNRMDGAIWAGVYGSQGKARGRRGIWTHQRGASGKGRPADSSRHRRCGRRPHDHGTGRSSHHPQRRRGRRLRRGRRHQPTGRRLRQGRRGDPVTHICRWHRRASGNQGIPQGAGAYFRGPGQPLRPENPSRPGAAKSR